MVPGSITAEGSTPEGAAARGIFGRIHPPFDLTSDLLFVVALAPTAPLRRAFPDQPFLSLAGHTPLVMWFSRIQRIEFTRPEGGRGAQGGPGGRLYNELNVVALLWRRAFFVPGIYATSAITIWAGHRYGMPKGPTRMQLATRGRRFASRVEDGDSISWVRARLLHNGRGLGRLCNQFWPLRIWPARFPSGRAVRAQILRTPRIQLARTRGRLALSAPWLPRPLRLWPLGVYLPGQRMRLPPP